MGKTIKKLVVIILIGIIFGYNVSYASFADLDYGPGNQSMADFSDEKAEEEKEKNEKESDQKTSEDYVGKSSNNYLKSLTVENGNIEPEFNRQYTDYKITLDNDKIKEITINAEAEDSKAIVEGAGKIKIDENTEIIRVTVKAENGDVQLYDLHLKNFVMEENTGDIVETVATEGNNKSENNNEIQSYKNKYGYIILFGVIIVIIMILINKKKKNK